MCQENLKSVYYSYFNSLMIYGIIFWGNSAHSTHVFPLQKRVIRIIADSRPRDSCRQLFKKLGILPLISQYIFPFYYLLQIIKIYFRWILKYIILILGIILSSTSHQSDKIQKWDLLYWYQSFQLPSHSYKKFIS